MAAVVRDVGPFERSVLGAFVVFAAGMCAIRSDAAKEWTENRVNPVPATPIAMGAFGEYTGGIGGLNADERAIRLAAIEEKIALQNNKAQLDLALNACVARPDVCDPNLVRYTKMIETVKEIPSPMEKVSAINAWVNSAIRYDTYEAAHVGIYRSMLGTLIDNRGVCVEQARLKMHALERVGFAPDNIRYVVEHTYENGKQTTVDHAVAVVRLDMKSLGHVNWVLNNNQASLPQGYDVQPAASREMITNNSYVEEARVHLGFSGKSKLLFTPKVKTDAPVKTYVVPYFSANFVSSTILRNSADVGNSPIAGMDLNYSIGDTATQDRMVAALTLRPSTRVAAKAVLKLDYKL